METLETFKKSCRSLYLSMLELETHPETFSEAETPLATDQELHRAQMKHRAQPS